MKQESIRSISKRTGIPISTLYDRWNKGDRGERLERPQDARDLFIHGKTLSEWTYELFKATGQQISRSSLYDRLKYQRTLHGYSNEKALAIACNRYLKEAKAAGCKVTVQPVL